LISGSAPVLRIDGVDSPSVYKRKALWVVDLRIIISSHRTEVLRSSLVIC